MQDIDIIKSIKKVFNDKDFSKIFFTSLLSLVILFILGSGVIWYYRANIFDYFAREYLQDMQDTTQVTTEKIIEKQSIFTQERFVIDAVKKTNPAVVSIIISNTDREYIRESRATDNNTVW